MSLSLSIRFLFSLMRIKRRIETNIIAKKVIKTVTEWSYIENSFGIAIIAPVIPTKDIPKVIAFSKVKG